MSFQNGIDGLNMTKNGSRFKGKIHTGGENWKSGDLSILDEYRIIPI
jgi:hypothetical protein